MLINLVFDVKICNVLIFNYLVVINKNRLYTVYRRVYRRCMLKIR